MHALSVQDLKLDDSPREDFKCGYQHLHSNPPVLIEERYRDFQQLSVSVKK
jgi:hypothetical protein